MQKSILFLIAVSLTASAARQPFSTDDLWSWRLAADPRVSPDGQSVVYVERWNDHATDARFANLWQVSTDGRTRRQFTQGNWHDESPRWSPDSARVAWISDRAGSPQLWVAPRESGAPVQFTKQAQPVLSFSWSQDSEFIAFTALVPGKAAAPAWAPPELLPHIVTPRQGHVHIFVMPAAGGAPRQLTTGAFDYVGEPGWVLDGHTIVAARTDGVIYAIQVADGTAKALTDSGRNESPLPSPDGNKIAWLALDGKPRSYAAHHIYVMNTDGSRAKMLTGSLDRDAANLQWSSDGRTVYFTADDHGSTHVYAARNDGTVRQVTSAVERLRGFSLADNGRAVAIRSTGVDAGDVFTFTVDRVSQPVTLSAPNEHLLADRDLGAVEEIHYDFDGNSVQAWIVKPPRFDSSKKYPLLLDVQDDPRAMYGPDFNLRAQIFASRGFVVLCANPRGSPGYGEQFGMLLPSRYPGDDYTDLMRGVDFVIAKGYIDPQRLSITGGLVAAWAIGHTDRFHRAVARRPIVDWLTNIATSSDGLRRAVEWMGVMPWEDADQYVKHSPIYFAQNFKTPTLVLASDPDPESAELYFALQARKVESALIRTDSAKPSGEIAEWNVILGWLTH